jgi:hypothetical protein
MRMLVSQFFGAAPMLGRECKHGSQSFFESMERFKWPLIPFPEQHCFNFVLEMEGAAKGDPGEAVSIQAPWATLLWSAE